MEDNIMSQNLKLSQLESLPYEGLLRISQVLKLIPVSKSSWWQGVKLGKFPKPLKLGMRTTVWRISDIRALINGYVSAEDEKK